MKKGDFISANQLRKYYERSMRKSLKYSSLDILLILGAATLCEAFWTLPLYILTVMLIGARQIEIGSIGLHDGAHGLLSESKKVNDYIAEAISHILMLPFYYGTFSGYRKKHILHHRHLNTNRDPERQDRENLYRQRVFALMLRLAFVLTGLFIVMWSIKGAYALRGRRQLIHIAYVISLCSLAIMDFYADWAGVLYMYWIVPLFTWGLFVDQLRETAEHYPVGHYKRDDGTSEIFRTREVVVSWFDRLFVVTRSLSHHLTHHLFPAVPFYNLPMVYKLLSQSGDFRQHAHVMFGYHRVIWEYCFQQNKYVGKL